MADVVTRCHESALSPADYEKACTYVCYERHYFYLFAVRAGFDAFPLFYLDRFLGWRFDTGPEPLVPVQNGFRRFLDKHAQTSVTAGTENLYEELRDHVRSGASVAVDAWWAPHEDKIPGVTSILFEAVNEAGALCFTKVNETRNRLRTPMTERELLNRISLDDDGTTTLTVISDPSWLREAGAASPHQTFVRLFRGEYGYRRTGDGVVFQGEDLAIDTSGIQHWVSYLDGAESQFIGGGAVPKHEQFLLNKSVRNAFSPVQHYLAYVSGASGLADKMPASLIRELDSGRELMRVALHDIHKFSSLLVQRPVSRFYRMYVDAACRLEETARLYQRMQLDLIDFLLQSAPREADA
ncbi:hypothetical protein [Actinoplanes philippinensis]|uniref:hypothetical protein n=1 Tax=Actinoplanes philippinensis TaxID=35752 RepID=UPI0033E4E081